MSLFPMIQPQAQVAEQSYPLCKEVKWDYHQNKPVFEQGAPVVVEGADAVMVWAWKALQAPRFCHDIYSWSYGNELNSLIGENFTEELKCSEAARYVRECLLINPYITAVDRVTVEFQESKLLVSCAITTIYGGIRLEELYV